MGDNCEEGQKARVDEHLNMPRTFLVETHEIVPMSYSTIHSEAVVTVALAHWTWRA